MKYERKITYRIILKESLMKGMISEKKYNKEIKWLNKQK